MPCDDCSRAETCPPCVNSDARERLAEAVWGNNDLTYEEADRLIDDFAHQLAEKQRAKLTADGYGGPCACGGCSWCLAQDYIGLIDPKARA